MDLPKFERVEPNEEFKKDEHTVKILNEWDKENIQLKLNKAVNI